MGVNLAEKGIGCAQDRQDGIPTHREIHGAFLPLLVVQFAGHHGEIHHSVDYIRHSFAGTAGGEVDADLRILFCEFASPLHGEGI